MVYSNRNRWYNNFDGEKLAGKFKVWMACYWSEYYYTSTRWAYGDDLASFKWHYDMWQYGVTDSVDGIDGYVDMNIAFFGYANYKVNGAQDAALTVKNKKLTAYYGHDSEKNESDIDFMADVKGTNSIGYDMDVDYEFINSDGDTVDEETALSTPGKYTVRYSFKDPKSGMITSDAELNVVEVTAKLVTPDINITLDKSGKPVSGFSFTKGVSGTNSLSEDAKLTGFVVNKKDIASGEVTELSEEAALEEQYDFTKYEYNVVYSFDVPKDGTVTQNAAIKNPDGATEAETATQAETKVQKSGQKETE